MIVIGLTGGIGAGKSTFASLLERRGAVVVDVDAVGRSVIAPGGPAADAVERRFGTLDRAALAATVFTDPAARHDLESITWPAIHERLQRVVSGMSDDAVVVLDMAVLAQGDLGKGIYGPVITVEAPMPLRLERLVQRGMSEGDARARMASQPAESTRRAIADVVIVNDGDLNALDAAATTAWGQLVRRATR